ncbi:MULTISPECIES: BON domain-containing protein [unclassified Achromobacter]|uniref:BON domain-containing protein n=1 Tax=unclassified Achromobacter TaxID=2626865 RepID=UPI000B514FEA|nr:MULTISPECIES: BON domain-containing protein [unclassified Achromobacter]OWT74677.1 ornithine aminotransferase [Achromobacter sp. HZ34]OWT79144.1 ornithine aminotransferase [Achromobacter sp. HZ28]
MDDTLVCMRVQEELASATGLGNATLQVQVGDGIVLLTGTVASYAEKCRATRAVRRVAGVVESIQEILVLIESPDGVSDESLLWRVERCLAWAAAIPAGAVKVFVRRGWVTLRGVVDWNFQREECERIVGQLAGVVGIINLLTVRARLRAIDPMQSTTGALRRNAEIRSSDIAVIHTCGNVVLTGTVRNWYERRAIRRVAWSIPGVTLVRDRMQVL